MKILAITQARMGSSRLPNKVIKRINGQSLLEIHLKRIKKSRLISKLIVATTKEPTSGQIIETANSLDVSTYQGSTNNVLERFLHAARIDPPDFVVRLTSDCPLIDAGIIDQMIEFTTRHGLDYASNTLKPTFPDGMDVEVFKYRALEKAFLEASLKSELEHVTPYIWKHSTFMGADLFKSDCLLNDIDYSDFRLTVDTQEDLIVISKLIESCGTERSWAEYVEFLQLHPDIRVINQSYRRNEGYIDSVKKDHFTDG